MQVFMYLLFTWKYSKYYITRTIQYLNFPAFFLGKTCLQCDSSGMWHPSPYCSDSNNAKVENETKMTIYDTPSDSERHGHPHPEATEIEKNCRWQICTKPWANMLSVTQILTIRWQRKENVYRFMKLTHYLFWFYVYRYLTYILRLTTGSDVVTACCLLTNSLLVCSSHLTLSLCTLCRLWYELTSYSIQ